MILNNFLDLSILFCFSFITLFIYRKLARKIGLVDKPNARKQHQGSVPLVGGLSICTALLFYIYFHIGFAPRSIIYSMSVLLLVLVGVIDDKFDISFKVRLAVQVGLSAIMMLAANLKLQFVGDVLSMGSIHLGIFSYFITVIAVVGAINAFNMVDGIDGLLGGLAVVTFGALSIILYLAGAEEFGFLCIVIIVSILPYIMMNLGILGRERKVFMGDAGSMLIGFTVIWFILIATQEEAIQIMRPITALWLIAVPLMDMAAIMYRRIRRGDSPFKPDREHLHHIFQRLGCTPRQTLAIICLIAAGFAGFGIWGEVNQVPEPIMFALFIAAFVAYAVCLSHIWVITSKLRKLFRVESLRTFKKVTR
ncbi:UDP-N-acetylglucosamine--undecaprenyl-phosphate N-acetylglucosaminephosphotransferase [Vibrio sp. ZSDE26]|uniref:Undecaprenyl-phosphate alpha-N-acetylglucosaminyl 1-phosphate transferase n=1 Tax=Vibrio amylolyticus TaxID=2847292 RepID=A0A9X1XHR0_9VIBR|nr:UDP-N-acetylglucosamine--undecaprenyl-phosphate N-acetylglucosaminephosphotransferase [Vibrio amylolyticus]MCK6263222.1 UDP-N-acetylglucosamine--undecaprenyl-phosphate N-acetylglucosaminephosphotransferase [Vibrio amylolyticus]